MYNSKGIRTTKITYQDILAQVSEYSLWCFYTNLDIKLRKKILSPIREERDPSAAFFQTKDSILLKDFGTGKTYNIFMFLKEKLNLGYLEAITRMQADFRLLPHSGEKIAVMSSNSLIEHSSPVYQGTEILVKRRPFSAQDTKYWEEYFISQKTRKILRIDSLKCFWVQRASDFIEYCRKPQDLIFCFSFGDAKYKIYNPKKKEGKWFSNVKKDTLMGANSLSTKEPYILTKGMKELSQLRELRYNSEALQAETSYPSEKIMQEKMKFKERYILADSDLAGIKCSKYFNEKYNFKIIQVPKGAQKDFAEFTKINGLQVANQLIQQQL